MVEHIAWVGPNYAQGISGQKVAIAGYSHWGDEPDHNEFTLQCIANVKSGTWNIRFFNAIQEYFRSGSRADFWDSVLFFNFVPSSVGGGEQRYADAGPEQRVAGQERVLRLLKEHRPNKLIVFSRGGWDGFPPTLEEQEGMQCLPLGDGSPPAFTWGRYSHSPVQNSKTIAVGLRHPQYASTAIMQAAVTSAMALRG